MKLEQSFEVAAPVDRVWQALIDVEQVAPCLPGAAITERNEDGTYNGTFTIKIGPTTASYTGKLEMENVDEGAHTATLQAQGTDKRGQGGAKATIVSKVTEAGDGATRVEVDTDYHITGRLARFGRGGMIEDISEKLLKEFAARLQSSLAGGPPAGGEPETPPSAEQAAEETAPPPTDAPASEVAGSPPDEGPAPTPPEAAVSPPAPEVAEPPPPTEEPPKGPPLASEPLDAGGLVGGVVLERIRSNPWPLIGGVVVLLMLRRRRRRRRAALEW